MSHIATVRVQLKDVSALEAAAKELGLTVIHERTFRTPFTANQPCAFKLAFPNSKHEIGVIARRDGTYDLAYDRWGGVVERILGKDAARFKQLYSKHAVINAAWRQGFTYTVREEAGKIVINLSR